MDSGLRIYAARASSLGRRHKHPHAVYKVLDAPRGHDFRRRRARGARQLHAADGGDGDERVRHGLVPQHLRGHQKVALVSAGKHPQPLARGGVRIDHLFRVAHGGAA